jgi:hypothetical protein
MWADSNAPGNAMAAFRNASGVMADGRMNTVDDYGAGADRFRQGLHTIHSILNWFWKLKKVMLMAR